MALLSAVAALLGVLLVCPDIVGTSAPPHERAAGSPASARTLTAAGPAAAPVYVCPYDRDDCRLLPALGPAVLTAPPLDPPVHATGPAAGGGARDDGGRTLPADARPRAPDLHVLQVLRS